MTATLMQARPAAAVEGSRGQHVLVQDPASGTVIRMSVGRQLVLRFRPRVGASRWRVAGRPDHLAALAGTGNELCFLVFAATRGSRPGTLLLERADPTGRVHETRELVVLPVS